MASEFTIFSPALRVNPWSDTDAPDPSDRGIRPLGELLAVTREGAVDQPGVSDNAVIRVNINLPINFMYTLTDCACAVTGIGLPAASNWVLGGSLLYQNTVAGALGADAMEYHIGMIANTAVQENGFFNVDYRPAGNLPSFLQEGGGNWQARFNNQTDNDIAVTFDCVFRFLIYTVQQQYDAGVNTPTLIR